MLRRAGCVSAVALSLLAPTAVAAPRLDDRFGDGGVARAPFRGQGQELFGTLRPARQADGKVLVAAQPDPDHGQTFKVMLARFTREGGLDRTFGHR
jgi:hypothetical protein